MESSKKQGTLVEPVSILPAGRLPAVSDEGMDTLALDPLVEWIERQPNSQRLFWIKNETSVPAPETACRICPKSHWQIAQASLICVCQETRLKSWDADGMAGSHPIETTLCSFPIRLALLREAKARAERGEGPPTGNGSASGTEGS